MAASTFIESLARRPNGWWLRRLTGRDPARYGVGRPLFFHHVPKTAGISLIKAIGKMVLPELAVYQWGSNLSATLIAELVERGLTSGQFIYGHPGHGAAALLRGRTHIITLLREPRDQVISNYLYVQRNRRVPDHSTSRVLEFREFILARPRFAIFQTASLHVGIVEQPVGRTEDLIDTVPNVLAYLDEMALVGVVGQVDGFMSQLAEIMEWPQTPRFPHRHKTRISSRLRERMWAQFEDLRHHPMLSSLFEAERAVYLHACAIGQKSHRRGAHPEHAQLNEEFASCPRSP
jgi:hypothetical protein